MTLFSRFSCWPLLLLLSVLFPLSASGEPKSKLAQFDYIRHPFGVLPGDYQHVPPVIDHPDEPFDWYRTPRCVTGVYGGPEETLITGDGGIMTDFATLRFFTGDGRQPLNNRVKTFLRGYLPLVQMHEERHGVRYHVEIFTTMVEGVAPVSYSRTYGLDSLTVDHPVDNMVNFVRLTITNSTTHASEVKFSAGLLVEGVPEPPDIGILSPPKQIPGLAESLGYRGEKRTIEGNGKLLCTLSESPATVHTLRDSGELQLTYRWEMEPGESRDFYVKLPYFPANTNESHMLHNAGYDHHRNRTIDFWEELLGRKAATITTGEAKVDNAYKAGIIYTLIDPLDIVGEHYFFHDNPTIYDKFWIRGSALNFRGLELAGFGDVVGEALMLYLDWQADDGEFVGTHPEQWDGHGQALWSLGHHFIHSGDTAWARKVFPAVKRGMAWQWHYRQEAWGESGGMMPYLHMADNEGVHGHLVGYNLWAISGAKGAIALAKGVGETELARRWEARTRQYQRMLRERCRDVYENLGVVPPALEGLEAKAIRAGWYGGRYGLDWGNMMLVSPSETFHPDNEMVTGSLKRWRQMSFEGIMTYPQGGRESYLHSYTPFYISEARILRDEQWEAVRDLYNHLVHTSATHMAAEGMNAAGRWGWIPETPAMPHSQFPGKYLDYLRDFLTVEWKDTLHIARAISPEWIRKQDTLGFRGPTRFGPLAHTIQLQDTGMTLKYEPAFRTPPNAVILHAPQHTAITGVKIDGNPVEEFGKRSVELAAPAYAQTVEIRWQTVTEPPPLSYQRAVEDYLLNYRKMVGEPSLHLEESWKISPGEVRTGEECTVTATVVNTGGAGFPADSVALFVDGERVQTGPRELRRGIGFDSPPGIISFRPNREGRVEVTFAFMPDEPGTCEITVGLGRGDTCRTLEPKRVTVTSVE